MIECVSNAWMVTMYHNRPQTFKCEPSRWARCFITIHAHTNCPRLPLAPLYYFTVPSDQLQHPITEQTSTLQEPSNTFFLNDK